VAIESATPQDEQDKRFKQLLDQFNQRVNDIRRKKAQEEADNYAAKKAVMDELRALITEEENIGTAFQRFKDLQERWKAIGPVPQQHYRELQSDYSHLRDEFHYHIRIYQELRDHDLRKNTALKQALISDMEALAAVDSVRDLETKVREYQEKWHEVGPVLKEEWEAIRDGFWNATRTVYDKIHEYYKVRRTEHEANLAAKQQLVERIQAVLVGAGEATAKEWREFTDKVLAAQNEWKSIGFATKKENERIWKEFRQTCNAFFDAKKDYFDKLKEQYREVRERKQALLAEALELKDSTQWKQTAERLKQLQQEWKAAGSAGPRDEHKLWSDFRKACDSFFQTRKAHFAEQDAAQAENVKAKEALIAEIEAFQHTGERNKDLETLKAFSQRWMESGRVSPRHYDALSQRYRTALDRHYEQLKVEGEERRKLRFQNHVEELKTAPGGREHLQRESRVVKRKMEELQNEVRLMEENMGIFNFKSASGEAMKRDMEKKMDRVKREIERLREQHTQLVKELR
jgi:hypothetical protein